MQVNILLIWRCPRPCYLPNLMFPCISGHRILCFPASLDTRSLRGRFAAPVYPGDTLRVELWDEGQGRVRLRVWAFGSGEQGVGKAREVIADGEGRVDGSKMLSLKSRL